MFPYTKVFPLPYRRSISDLDVSEVTTFSSFGDPSTEILILSTRVLNITLNVRIGHKSKIFL